MLEKDICQRILHDFGSVADEAFCLIAPMAGEFSPRVIRCVVYLAERDFGTLLEKIRLARTDWRDVILNAEYDHGSGERIRDFTDGFPDTVP